MDTDLKNGTTHDTGAELEKEEQATQDHEKQDTKDEQGQVPYARFQQANERRKVAEKVLDDVVQSLVDEVPENLRSIVPDLPAAQKVVWLKNAKNAGLFESKKPLEQNSPDAARPQSKPNIDLNTASPHTLMSAGYK